MFHLLRLLLSPFCSLSPHNTHGQWPCSRIGGCHLRRRASGKRAEFGRKRVREGVVGKESERETSAWFTLTLPVSLPTPLAYLVSAAIGHDEGSPQLGLAGPGLRDGLEAVVVCEGGWRRVERKVEQRASAVTSPPLSLSPLPSFPVRPRPRHARKVGRVVVEDRPLKAGRHHWAW